MCHLSRRLEAECSCNTSPGCKSKTRLYNWLALFRVKLFEPPRTEVQGEKNEELTTNGGRLSSCQGTLVQSLGSVRNGAV